MSFLPFSTPYDPAEEPPGSIDPLGTLTDAERLADILLPGFTARMWRPRLLTFTAVAAVIADRVTKFTGRDEDRLEARLVLERLFVAAIARQAREDPDEYRNAIARLPGRTLAERAWRDGEPVRQGNFLKGQAVNGPYGVMARLSRTLALVEGDGALGVNGVDLLLAWSLDQSLTNFLEDPGQGEGEGVRWAKQVTKAVCQELGKQDNWPGSNQQIWGLLADRLRPDKIAGHERKAINRTLTIEPLRQRMIELLRAPGSLNVYRASLKETRGRLERNVLLAAVGRLVLTDDPSDRLIAAAVGAIDAYEEASAVLEQVFDALLWGLRKKSGSAKRDDVLSVVRVTRSIKQAVSRALAVGEYLKKEIAELKEFPIADASKRIQSLELIRDDVVRCGESVENAVSTVIARHEKVQRSKRKATWVDFGTVWTLMSGSGSDTDRPPIYRNVYLHPMRIVNCYSFLRDLRLVDIPSVGAGDES